MKYTISLSEDGTYVRIRVSETITGEGEKDFAQNAIKDAKAHRINKFLVDVRGAPNKASSLEQYRFGHEDVKQFGLDRGARIAVLADTDDQSHDFIETVFVNAGYCCRLFQAEDLAVEWLGE
ncbi:hypothetical protein ACFL6U_19030 [Planctomycetota bacterium]